MKITKSQFKRLIQEIIDETKDDLGPDRSNSWDQRIRELYEELKDMMEDVIRRTGWDHISEQKASELYGKMEDMLKFLKNDNDERF